MVKVKPRTLLWREATDLGPLKVVQESRLDSQEVFVERGIGFDVQIPQSAHDDL